MSVTLSIVVPMHKLLEESFAERLIGWCKEAGSRCELIFSLDHAKSDDALSEWCNQQALKNLVVVHANNGNPGETRNIGLRATSGEWVAFVDSDDLFDPQLAIQVIDELGELSDLIVCGYRRCQLLRNEKSEIKAADELEDLFSELGFWRSLYRRDFLAATEFPKMRMGEDQVFFSRVLAKNPRITFSSSLIYEYYDGGINQLSKAENSIAELKKAVDLMVEELAKSEHNLEFRKLMICRQLLSIPHIEREISLSRFAITNGIFALKGFRYLRAISCLWNLLKFRLEKK